MKFKVKCNWVVESEIIVEAASSKEALDKTADTDTKDFPSPTYVDDTFEMTTIEEVIDPRNPTGLPYCSGGGCYGGCPHDPTDYSTPQNASTNDIKCQECAGTGLVEEDATGALGYTLNRPCPRGCSSPNVSVRYELEEEPEDDDVPDTLRDPSVVLNASQSKCIAIETNVNYPDRLGKMCSEPCLGDLNVCYDHAVDGPPGSNRQPINPPELFTKLHFHLPPCSEATCLMHPCSVICAYGSSMSKRAV